jgi:hypothetical protein
VFGSGLSRCSPVAMVGGSCQSPPPLLHAAVALHVLHVRAELLLAAVRITSILGRRVGRQAWRRLSILGLAELLRLLGGAGLRRDLYCGATVNMKGTSIPIQIGAVIRVIIARALRDLYYSRAIPQSAFLTAFHNFCKERVRPPVVHLRFHHFA